jgi:hypothetical protein
MRHPFRYLLGALGTAVMILSLVASLEIQLATARPGTGVEPLGIDRTLKGDRLHAVPGRRGQNPIEQPKLPNGCEASFSSTRNIYANEIAGRCVAALPMATLAG